MPSDRVTPMPDHVWILLDGRAKVGRQDEAHMLDLAETEEEAREAGETTWEDHDAIWVDPSGDLRWDVPPANDRVT